MSEFDNEFPPVRSDVDEGVQPLGIEQTLHNAFSTEGATVGSNDGKTERLLAAFDACVLFGPRIGITRETRLHRAIKHGKHVDSDTVQAVLASPHVYKSCQVMQK